MSADRPTASYPGDDAMFEVPGSRLREMTDQIKALRAELAEVREYWTDLSNQVLEHAPEDYDDDCAADAIAIRYVRDLETAWGSVRQLAQRWVDLGATDLHGALALEVFRATALRQVEGADRDAAIERESIEDALENDRCGICGSVGHFREDHK